MDLVNSVTQNSNNRNTTMENQSGGNDDNSKKGDNERGKASGAPEHKGQHFEELEKKTSQVPDYLRAIGMDPRKFWPKKYRFTREKSPGQHNPLTIAQRNFYETNGFIVLDDCVSGRLLEQILLSKRQSESEQSRQLSFVNEFLSDKLLLENNRLTQYVKCFCDEKCLLMTHRLIESFQSNDLIKNMDANGMMEFGHESNDSQASINTNRQALFRDLVYLPFRPIDKVVGTIIAFEPIEHVILVVPGTHRVGQCTISSTIETESGKQIAKVSREIWESAPEKLSKIVDKSQKKFKYINLKAGQTLFYHPGLVHGFSSDLVNLNKRQLASLAYYAAADCEFVDLGKSMPENHQRNGKHNELVLPISLAHFNESDPRDYRSWLDKPKLFTHGKASL